jgi:GT2 family glycosyltransferase/SAM-dependent methyltransferase
VRTGSAGSATIAGAAGSAGSAGPAGIAGPSTEPLVGVVAIIYGQSDEELADFLVAVEGLSHRRRLVFLVNNQAGRDLSWLSSAAPSQIELVDSGRNGGFTGGANIGIRAALRSGCDRVLLLNTDITILRNDLIERLGEAFSQDTDCAMVSPVMLQAPRTDLVWYSGAVLGRWSWIPRHPGINRAYEAPELLAPRRTSGICGCCVLIAGQALGRLGAKDPSGAFDEDLFSYFDDADLSRRATRAGLHLYVWPEALLAHQKDGRRLSAIETYYFGRNPFVLMRKHASPLTWPVGLLAQLCVALPATLGRAATPRARGEAWRGTLHGIGTLLMGRGVGKGHRETGGAAPAPPAADPVSASRTVVVERCDLCGASATEHVMATRDRLFGLPGEFSLVRCGSCGLVRLSPRPLPEDLGSFYRAGDYYAYATDDGLPRYQRAVVTALGPLRESLRGAALGPLGYPGAPAESTLASVTGAVLRRSLLMQRVAGYAWEVPPFVAGGRALDVGCGNARYLASLAELGWEVAGVDQSPAAAVAAQEAHGISVHVGTIESAPFSPGSFDFVHMRHVIEHLDQPVQSLQRVFELLRPGGWLYVETPNLESFPARVLGQHWFNLDSPRHLWLFDTSTLSSALGVTGFELDRCWTFVTIRCCSWASTYRREEESGAILSRRPSVGVRYLWSSMTQAVLARAAVHVSPHSGDIVACWARKPG